MASTSKKSKGKRPIQEAEHNTNPPRFLSEEAAEFFKSSSKYRITPERPVHENTIISMEIIEHRWDKLCQPPSDPGSRELTREFHANLRDAQDNKVYMRGTYIDISPRNINKYFDILHLEEEDDYSTMLLATILETEIAAVVTRGGFTLSKAWTSIPRAHLTEEAWYWYMVSCHNLLPKVVNSSVTKPRVLLIYTLLKNIHVNVGSLIH